MTGDEGVGRADERVRKVLRAGKLATFNAWTLAIFGAGSLLLSFTSLAALVVGGALLVVAWVEFRGRTLLRQLDPRGPRILAWNQLALFALLVLYCLWSIRVLRVRPPDELDTLAALAGLPPASFAGVMVLTYLAVIAGSLVLLGLAAWYYWSRGRLLREYLADTGGPPSTSFQPGGAGPSGS